MGIYNHPRNWRGQFFHSRKLITLLWLLSSGGCTAHLKFYDNFLMADSPGYSTLDDDVGVKFSRAWINCDSAIAAASTKEVLVM